MGRATKNIVSGYQRDRVFRTCLYASESRQLVTDFNGAIPADRSIVQAVWQTWENQSIAMGAAEVSERLVQIRVSAQYSGRSRIKLDVTLDNGDIFSAWHIIRVMGAPYFDNPGWVAGPHKVVATPPVVELP